MSTPLEKELETFDKLKPQLLADEGKFAVICGEELVGLFSTYDDALKLGFAKCGVKPFLVKKIASVEPINFFSRKFETAA